MALPTDPHWPRAGAWPAWQASGVPHPDAVLLGVPTHATSLSATGAHATPAAVREALRRYSPTVMGPPPRDLNEHLTIVDAGDIDNPDTADGIERTVTRVAELLGTARRLIAIGGDNSLTYPVARGAGASGLITFDAHFDLRDGVSNGSPVRRLIEDAPPGQRIAPHRVVQIGIADYANSVTYAERAAYWGIRVITLDELRHRGIADVATEALHIATDGHTDTRVHLDIDVDVCDRSVAPGCPASLPGGLAAWELRTLTRTITRDPRIVSVDITEVDATTDTPDQRTVRLAALCLLDTLAGLI